VFGADYSWWSLRFLSHADFHYTSESLWTTYTHAVGMSATGKDEELTSRSIVRDAWISASLRILKIEFRHLEIVSLRFCF